MRVTNKASARPNVQYAALPYRTSEASGVEVLLVTSRTTRRWIIPKGWPKRGMPPYDTAAREAFEEAGVVAHADQVVERQCEGIGAVAPDQRR